MITLTDDIKKFYIENPEMFDKRRFLSMEGLEDYLRQHDMMIISKPCFEKWEAVWKIAQSYWIMPEEEDMKVMVDKIYSSTQKPKNEMAAKHIF